MAETKVVLTEKEKEITLIALSEYATKVESLAKKADEFPAQKIKESLISFLSSVNELKSKFL